MAKHYSITHSNTTDWWVWECKDGSAHGTAPSRAEARRLARENCTGECLITPPAVDFEVVNGYLVDFQTLSLDDRNLYFTSGEISEDVFNYLFGFDVDCENLRDADIVAAMLKIWGVYNGGRSMKSLMANHNLTSEQFAALSKKSWKTIELEIDEKNNYSWIFDGSGADCK